MRILVTGGAGYIGATAVAMLLEAGYDVTVLDDLSTGHSDVIPTEAKFVKGSLLSNQDLDEALTGCDAVMHFAAKSLVGESVEKPDLYAEVNVGGSKALFSKMKAHGIKKIVLSSTAATYGEPKRVPISENDEPAPKNPYGATKLEIDRMVATSGFSAISLRYFNVAGALQSANGWLAERHNPETHLIPNILKATNDAPVKIFGTDWPTEDGTCIRDYIHVVDLIEAHIKALETLPEAKHEIINLGSGDGYSVRQVIAAAEKAVGHKIPAIESERRAGDPAILIADITKAKSYLNWQPNRGIDQMVLDTWNSIK
ncbi:MAG: UDP-glucose 4-epimerase GalE [Candidatus Nanopelagicaceae bacterium]|nr:UDP-glucose 4-epimerase GalE [Candidatus Nanopelagicaceae bacterium]